MQRFYREYTWKASIAKVSPSETYPLYGIYIYAAVVCNGCNAGKGRLPDMYTRAQGCSGASAYISGQCTSSCVATNMLHFHGLTVFMQTLVTYDYVFEIIVLQTLAMHFFYTDTCRIALWV